MNNNSVAVLLNGLFYLITVFLIYRKTKSITIGVVLLAIYAVSALFSIILYFYFNGYGVTNYNNITLFPFVYLYVMLLINFIPIIKFKEYKIRNIIPPNSLILKFFTYFIIAISLYSLIKYLPEYITKISTMIINNDEFADTYRSGSENSMMKTSLNYSNLVFVVASSFSDIVLFLFFYYLTKKKSKVIIILLGISMLLPLLQSIANAGRYGLITFLLTTISLFTLFRNLIDKKILRPIIFSFLLISIAILIVTFLITSSRFTNRDYGKYDTIYSIVSYAGQPMLNFNNYIFTAKGYENGDNTFPIIRMMLGLDYSITPHLRQYKWSSIMGIPLEIFYTFIGDFYLDYGPIISLILFILFSIFFLKNAYVSENIPIHRFLLIYILFLICSQGVFYFTYKTLAENLKIVSMILTYILLRLSRTKIVNQNGTSYSILSSTISPYSRK